MAKFEGTTVEEAISSGLKELNLTKKSVDITVISKVKSSNKKVLYMVETSNPSLIIGKHGRVLNAIQSLAQVYLLRNLDKRLVVTVDVGDYRIRREEKLNQIARQTVKEVQEYRQPVFLDPMPAFERKQIHALLSKAENITTHSEGAEPFRYLVVDYKKTSEF